MIVVAMNTRIRAGRDVVWQALTDPSQLVRWRPGHVEPVDPDLAYPRPGGTVRWRCRVWDLPLILEETPLSVGRGEHLRSSLALGLFRFEETFRLRALPAEPPRTRLAVRICAPNEVPVVGGALDRFGVRRFATELAALHLQALRDWCECGAAHADSLPSPLPAAARAAFGRS